MAAAPPPAAAGSRARRILKWPVPLARQHGVIRPIHLPPCFRPCLTNPFIDGPVTANKTLGVHTAWGRTLKDVFQRYKALRGFDQRYQNGFDCQGLWIEVGVERELGLNSKREIEEYGLEKFAQKCRDVVEWSSAELIKGSVRLGQWMDWSRDYYTFSDTNIEYIWQFLRVARERGWLYLGHRATEWCPRCGTSISAHELAGSYTDRDDAPVSVRLPLVGRDAEGWSSGPRRRGRCRPTWPRPCTRRRHTAAWPTGTGSRSSAAAAPRSTRSGPARTWSAGATAGHSTSSALAAASITGWSAGMR
jgi:hypothetical protein